jgi:APA family basic amino acid/polyamine antiporter
VAGAGSAQWFSAAVIVSASGALNAVVLAGGRIPFALGQDFRRLACLGQVDARFGTPLRSLLVLGLWAGGLALWGSFGQLLFFTGFAVWLFLGLTAAGVFVLYRRRAENRAVFRRYGYPFLPVFFLGCSAAMLAATIAYGMREAAAGALILLAGIPAYFAVRSAAPESGGAPPR